VNSTSKNPRFELLGVEMVFIEKTDRKIWTAKETNLA
jgi:hypothetical protein